MRKWLTLTCLLLAATPVLADSNLFFGGRAGYRTFIDSDFENLDAMDYGLTFLVHAKRHAGGMVLVDYYKGEDDPATLTNARIAVLFTYHTDRPDDPHFFAGIGPSVNMIELKVEGPLGRREQKEDEVSVGGDILAGYSIPLGGVVALTLDARVSFLFPRIPDNGETHNMSNVSGGLGISVALN